MAKTTEGDDEDKKRKEREEEDASNNDKKDSKSSKQQSSAAPPPPKEAPTLDPNKFTIHVVRLKPKHDADDDEDDDDITPEMVQERILRDFSALLPHLKRGDAVEDLDAGGYRSEGTYFVDAVDADAGTLTMIDRSYDLDEYGSQPLHFTCLDTTTGEGSDSSGGFAPDYFNPETAQTNDMYCPGEKASLYWHSDNGWSVLSKATADQIVVDENDNRKGTLQHRGQTYTFLGLPEGKLDNGMLVTCEYNAETHTFSTGFC